MNVMQLLPWQSLFRGETQRRLVRDEAASQGHEGKAVMLKTSNRWHVSIHRAVLWWHRILAELLRVPFSRCRRRRNLCAGNNQ